MALQASSLGYNVLTRTIELRDLSLAATLGSPPFLLADRVVVLVDPGIYLGRLTISRISVARPRLTLIRNSDGTMNLPAARNDAPSSSPLQLGVVSLAGLSMSLEDRAAQRAFTLGPLDLRLDTGLGARGSGGDSAASPGAFGPANFTVKAGEADVSGTIAGRLAFDGTRVRIEDLVAQTRQGRVVVDGWADVLGERPAISLNASATIDLPEAARLARTDTRGLTGRLEGTAEVTGALAAPAVRFAFTGRDVAYPPLGNVALAGRGSFSGTRVLIDGLDLNSSAGEVHADGSVELGDATAGRAAAPSHLALRWANLRIDDLARALGQPLAPGTGAVAAGTATLELDARERYPQLVSGMRAAATSTFQPVASASSRDSLALAGRADLQLDRGRWSLRHSIRTSRAQASLEGTMTGRLLDGADRFGSTLGGRSRLRVDDIASVPPLMKTAGVSVPPEAVDGLAGTMQATVNLAGTLEHPRARVDLTARDLRHRTLPQAASLDARLDVDAASVRVQDARALSGATALQAAGRYSWRGPLDASFEVDQRDLSEIASQFQLPVALSGSARLEGTIAGTLTSRTRSGQAALTLSAADVVVDQVPVGAITATGTLPLADGGRDDRRRRRAGRGRACDARDPQPCRLSRVRGRLARARRHRQADSAAVPRSGRRPVGPGIGDCPRCRPALGSCRDSRTRGPARGGRHGSRHPHPADRARIGHARGGSDRGRVDRSAFRRAHACHASRAARRRRRFRTRSRCTSAVRSQS